MDLNLNSFATVKMVSIHRLSCKTEYASLVSILQNDRFIYKSEEEAHPTPTVSLAKAHKALGITLLGLKLKELSQLTCF